MMGHWMPATGVWMEGQVMRMETVEPAAQIIQVSSNQLAGTIPGDE